MHALRLSLLLALFCACVATETLLNDTTGDCDPAKWKLPVDGHYDTTPHIATDKLNVHLIPHSHDDPGWIVTVDQYYMQKVQFILDTAVVELLRNPHRTFMYVEQSFFQRWWHEQSSEIKETVRKLIKEGRLDLTANGGWVMHDEATPHYTAMMDQTALGHKFLKEEFGIAARIGWQIDPFGHSATNAALLSAGVDFDALYFARMDYQDKKKRMKNKDLEFAWRPSKSRGKHQQVFTGEIIDHYGPPEKFQFGKTGREVQDDPELYNFNVCDEVDAFVKTSQDRASHQRGNHLFIPMGDDFAYDNAARWFKNMDKLIHYVNQDGRINVLYSNLTYYTQLKQQEGISWSVTTSDLMPYASDEHDYWTGFYTSRPALKKFASVANSLIQQLKQLDAIHSSPFTAGLDKLKKSVGLVQHHDGLSGTEKQVISDDYSLRMNVGVLEAEKEMNKVLFAVGTKDAYHLCLQANTSVCDVTTSLDAFEVLAHNAIPRKGQQTVSIPISKSRASVHVLSGTAKVVDYAVFKAMEVEEGLKTAPYSLALTLEMDPLATSRLEVKVEESYMEERYPTVLFEELSIENDLVKVTFDKSKGSIQSIKNKKSGVEVPLTSQVQYYQAYQGEGHKSGAYAFRPDSSKTHSVMQGDAELIQLEAGDVDADSNLKRVAFKMGEWTTMEYRLNAGDEFVEVEWTVGPIPIEDKIGKEVIIRFDTQGSIQSQSKFYSDSNGMELLERVRNHRDTWDIVLHDDQEVVASNYYPITAGVYIKDDAHQLSIATDRAQGATSLEDGQLEIMVHRRLLADDSKGVNEHLNETQTFTDRNGKKVTRGLVARGSVFLNVDKVEQGMKSLRSKMEKMVYTPLVAYRQSAHKHVQGKEPWVSVAEFPPNIGLTTLEMIGDGCVMARLSHLYAVDEHSELSKNTNIDLSKLFFAQKSKLKSVKELSLTGVWDLNEVKSGKMEWKTEEGGDGSGPEASKKLVGTAVDMQPMEVRTFQLCFSKQSREDVMWANKLMYELNHPDAQE